MPTETLRTAKPLGLISNLKPKQNVQPQALVFRIR